MPGLFIHQKLPVRPILTIKTLVHPYRTLDKALMLITIHEASEAHTLAPKYLYRDCFKAKVYSIQAHGPLGLVCKGFRRPCRLPALGRGRKGVGRSSRRRHLGQRNEVSLGFRI